MVALPSLFAPSTLRTSRGSTTRPFASTLRLIAKNEVIWEHLSRQVGGFEYVGYPSVFVCLFVFVFAKESILCRLVEEHYVDIAHIVLFRFHCEANAFAQGS